MRLSPPFWPLANAARPCEQAPIAPCDGCRGPLRTPFRGFIVWLGMVLGARDRREGDADGHGASHDPLGVPRPSCDPARAAFALHLANARRARSAPTAV